jgi:hypothetical protein
MKGCSGRGGGGDVPPPWVDANPAFREVARVAEALLLTKFKAWRYEDEVRMLVKLREDQRKGALYFADLDESIQPSTVIVGPRCSVTKGEIQAAAAGYPMPIAVVQATLSPTLFAVVEDANGFNGD